MQKKIPMRTCVGCLKSFPGNELIRLVRVKTEDGVQYMVNPTGRKNGRSAYLCKNSECLAKAKKNRGFHRSLKESIPDSCYDEIERILEIE